MRQVGGFILMLLFPPYMTEILMSLELHTKKTNHRYQTVQLKENNVNERKKEWFQCKNQKEKKETNSFCQASDDVETMYEGEGVIIKCKLFCMDFK